MTDSNLPAAGRRNFGPLWAGLWLAATAIVLCGATWALNPATWRPEPHSALLSHTVYAYRQWQSTGVELDVGDWFRLRASGQWQYSPIVGLNGPRGGRPAVPAYPLPGVAGGALLGRIGENGAPFYVGASTRGVADSNGLLYLRINDDLLGDNAGTLDVDIEVVRATSTPGQ
jgi:hypothetical protein